MAPVQLQKAFLTTETDERIECMFNPDRFEFAMSNRWVDNGTATAGNPSLRFVGGAGGRFNLSLVFDTTDTGVSVTQHTNKLLKLMEVDTTLPSYDSSRDVGRPPWVRFNWGTNIHTFKAIIVDLSIAFTYFSNEGLPLRSSVEMALEQFEPDANWTRQNPTSGTPHPHRTHTVGPGDTLDRIAATYYGDATNWRVIAAANGIVDPLALRPGSVLAIPDREGR